jgi:vacuolar-type H+-ATPase subunit E/Vma4
MPTDTQDVELLGQAILTEARDEAGHIKAEAAGKVEAIRKRAQDQAQAEKKSILDRAREDAERLRGQGVATAQLKARSAELENREKLLDSVFEAAKKQLDGLKKRADFDAIAALLLREALTQLRVNKAQVSADEATQKALKKGALEQIAGELKGEFSLGPTLAEGVGVVVDASEGKLHYDNTLETRLSRLQNTLRSSVYKVLMGEKP